ncbi:hypothetical protein [Legionella resiliens]|uniref:Uncharacterized protein n=1 Tax=Legionella resiliens TaxID=2905958 RepID=A0ABS8X584_9GAMM|nr:MULTISPECIES: hypothetical protein [unclassified Legionella]MCE0723359.1 hypothetical protein [Legionella sp. 9fVS26]MCE3532512.1 hypothetical protein [Legionella sp. 8cVS16]
MFLGTSLFWITIAGISLLTFIATVLGRGCAAFFPYRLNAPALFFLSPILGLALLTIIASLLGRFLPLGNTIFLPLLVIIVFIGVIIRERDPWQLSSHALMMIVFTFLCGSSLLLTLYLYGGFNAHNDAFTYLVHSNWLQTHAFYEQISPNSITPSTTQVVLYQTLGLRMGASFLLALVQALLHLQWSYEAYPTVAIVSIASCCLAIGFPLVGILRTMPRFLQLVLLSLPGFSLGGLVFGAHFGFLPQTLGLALGAALLFTLGPLFQRLSTIRKPILLLQPALPCALLFSAAVYAYSEFLPFLLFGVLASGLLVAWRFHAWKNFTLFYLVFLLFFLVILNMELMRTYSALRLQSHTIVGTAVDWKLIGYLAHALGIHGGAWDIFQWTKPDYTGKDIFEWTDPSYADRYILSGYCILLLIFACLTLRVKQLKRFVLSGVFLPTIMVLLVLGAGFIYFRYFVQAPFPIGKGQSWSQFKLSDWSHPFLMAILLFAFASWWQRGKRLFYVTISVVLFISSSSALWLSMMRIQPLLAEYEGINNLDQFYLNLRKEVLTNCQPDAPIYLALQKNDKLRQMITYFLADRTLNSDWRNDGYISPWLPLAQQSPSLKAKQCVLESVNNKMLLDKGIVIGPIQLGILSGKERVQIVDVSGTYDKESDEYNWWYWVEHKAHFKLTPLFISKEIKHTRLQFEYSTRGQQQLTLHIMTKNGVYKNIVMDSKGDELLKFSQIINLSPNELTEIVIETNGKSSPLSLNDQRKAAWIIRNLSVRPTIDV